MAKFKFDDKEEFDKVRPLAGIHRIDYDDGNIRGFALQTTQKAKRFLLVYVAKASGQERRMVIGELGKPPKLSLSAARRRAAELRALVDTGRDPWLEGKERRAAEKARKARPEASLGNMLTAYVDALRRAEKASAEGVNRELLSTVKARHPRLWNKRAADVTLGELVAIVSKLTAAKKWRQAEKTRSYIRAAYTMAAASKGNAGTADLFADFADVPNIGRDLATVERPKQHRDGAGSAGKRALSLSELAAYWTRIKAMPGPAGALLRFHLVTGAQRCAQLARLTTRSVDRDTATATLLDGKGRRKKAREHVVPLLPEAIAALDAMAGTGTFAFTTDGGANGAGFHAVRFQMAQVAADMVDAGEVSAPFTPGEIRITVETRLAAGGVPMETRAQLQSHGLGGVQNRHYDKHKYLDEKRAALIKLRSLLNQKKGEVIKFPARAG